MTQVYPSQDGPPGATGGVGPLGPHPELECWQSITFRLKASEVIPTLAGVGASDDREGPRALNRQLGAELMPVAGPGVSQGTMSCDDSPSEISTTSSTEQRQGVHSSLSARNQPRSLHPP